MSIKAYKNPRPSSNSIPPVEKRDGVRKDSAKAADNNGDKIESSQPKIKLKHSHHYSRTYFLTVSELHVVYT